jgi:hypothetical protein
VTRLVVWDPLSPGTNRSAALAALAETEAVVNLAGEPVFGRWTARRRAAIRTSRIEATRQLVALCQEARRPKTLLNASAVGYYGDRGAQVLTEASPAGRNFLAELGVAWEQATQGFPGRVVQLRIGVVLARGGGAVASMLPAFRLGLGGRLGSGSQYMSWIAMEDLLALILFALKTDGLTGPVNAVAPGAATNEQFTRTLATTLRRPAILPVPAFMLRLLFGRAADEMLLASARVHPQRALDAGFTFKHDLPSALGEACR